MRARIDGLHPKLAGVLGLFVGLAVAGASTSLAQPSLLEQLEKGGTTAPPPRKSTLPPLRLQIESAAAVLDERIKVPAVTFRLTERSGRLFAEFTKNNIGRVIEIRVDGKAVMRPVIREPILGGSVQITGNLTLQDAKDLADRLTSGSAKVEAEVVD